MGETMRRCVTVLPVAIPLALLAAGCVSAGTISTTPATAGTGAAGGAASSAAAKKAGVGDAIDLKGSNAGDLIEVTVVKVVDPDSANDGFSSPKAGARYVSVQLRITNKGTGAYKDDPQIDVKAKDATGQSFDPDITTTTSAGAQIDSGLNLAPGDKALGFVTFDVPKGDKIAQVQYGLNAGMFGSVGEWTVG